MSAFLFSKKFIKTTALYTVSGSLPLLSAILLLPFYVYFLPAFLFGKLAIYWAITLFTQVFTTFSFDSTLFVHHHDTDYSKEKFSKLVATAFTVIFSLGALLLVIFLIGGSWIMSALSLPLTTDFYLNVILSLVSGMLQAVVKLFSSLQQSRQRARTYFQVNSLLFILIVLFSILGLQFFPNTLMGPIAGRALAYLLISAWVLYQIAKEYGWQLDFTLIRENFSFNIYIYIYQLLQWGVTYMDRFVMLLFLSLTQIGLYDFGWRLFLVIDIVTNGYMASFYPQLTKFIRGEQQHFYSIEWKRYFHLLTAGAVLFITFLIPVYTSLFETVSALSNYKNVIGIIPLIAATYLFRSIRLFYATPYTPMKFTRPLPFIYAGVTAIKLLLLCLFIPRFELLGVAIANVLALLVEDFLLGFILKNQFRYNTNLLKIWGVPTLVLGGIIALFYYNLLFYSLNTYWLLFVATILLLLIVYWREMREGRLNKFKL